MKRFFCAMAVFGILGLGAHASLAKLSVWGTVYEVPGGAKIAGAKISVSGKQIFQGVERQVNLTTGTDSTGLYSFSLGGEAIPPVSVCASKDGYKSPQYGADANCFNLQMKIGTIDLHLGLKKK